MKLKVSKKNDFVIISRRKLLKILKLIDFQKQIDNLAERYKGKNVICYGAGIIAKYIFEKYDFSKLNIIAFADNKYPYIKEDFLGYKTIAPTEIKTLNPDLVIIFVYNDFIIKDYFQNNFPELKNVPKISVRDKSLFQKIKLYLCGYL